MERREKLPACGEKKTVNERERGGGRKGRRKE